MREASIDQLQAEFRQLTTSGRNFEAAIWAYSLAKRFEEEGDLMAAREAARNCVALLKDLPTAEIADVTHDFQSIGGISIPEYFHDDSVTNRLRKLLD